MTLMGNLQGRILSAANKESSGIDFNGSLHVLADLYNIPNGDVNGRTIAVAKQLDTSIGDASSALNYLLNNPGSVPTLGLNFLSESTLDNRITFTRSSNATYFDSAGLLATAGNNVARLDYDPSTLLPRGLLIEEQRTNSLLHSRDMTQAAWTKTDVTPTRNQVGIDGTANSACLMTEGSAGNASLIQSGAAVTAGSTVTLSAVLKRGNTDWVRVQATDSTGVDGAAVWFNLNTGVKGTTTALGAGTSNSGTITSFGGGWYRLTVTTLPNGAYTVPRLFLASASADASSTRVSNATYIVDCAQLETGSFASSIVITGAATATRSADVDSSTALILGATGTVVIEAVTPASSAASPVLYQIDDGTPNNRTLIYQATNGSIRVRSVTGGVDQVDVGLAIVPANTAFKVAATWVLNDFTASLNGAAVVTDATGTVPTVTTRRIGLRTDTTANWNSTIKRVTEYPTRLPNATLQSLTA